MISAVCGLPRDLFEELGGFSTDFTAYGGEDWELAHRAWVAGAVLAHVRDAVAWHDGPDWAVRRIEQGLPVAKNDEALALTRLLPDPVARGGGRWSPYPATVVTVPDHGPAASLAVARWAFRGQGDCAVWLTGPTASATVQVLDDPYVHAGPVPADVLARAQAVIALTEPARLPDLAELSAQAQRCGTLEGPAGRVVPGRTAARTHRWAGVLGADPELLAAELFGGHDVRAPEPLGPVDLAHELKALAERPPLSR